MTARSCASSTAKLARPTLVVSRSWFDKQFEHDRGRGQRQAGAEDDRLGRIAAGIGRDAGEQRGGDKHLQAAQAEHQPPHGQQPMQRQFETDQEQQEDDAELGDAGDVLGVADREPVQRAETSRSASRGRAAQQRAGAEIAEHRRKAEPADDRHHDARRAEHDQRVAIGGNIDRRGHDPPASRGRRLRRRHAQTWHRAARCALESATGRIRSRIAAQCRDPRIDAASRLRLLTHRADFPQHSLRAAAAASPGECTHDRPDHHRHPHHHAARAVAARRRGSRAMPSATPATFWCSRSRPKAASSAWVICCCSGRACEPSWPASRSASFRASSARTRARSRRSGRICGARPSPTAAAASPPWRCRRSTSRCGTRSAKRPSCRCTGCGGIIARNCRPTAPAASAARAATA